MLKGLRYFVFSWFLIILPIVPAQAIEVAITVDDLPVMGELPPHTTRMDVADKMLAVFAKHNLVGVYGFINAVHAPKGSLEWKVLEKWVAAGQLLGNHTYTHVNLTNVSAQKYIKEIEENEPTLSAIMGNKDYHYFRYTYLAEGNTLNKRETVRNYLFSHNYEIAPVTVDFSDYEWHSPYARCLRKNDQQSINWLEDSFIDHALGALGVARDWSWRLFGRDIKYVLLIHFAYFDAEMLDQLLTAYEQAGVTFISLPKAMEDHVHRIDPHLAREKHYTFLNQIILMRGLKDKNDINDIYTRTPFHELRSLCRK